MRSARENGFFNDVCVAASAAANVAANQSNEETDVENPPTTCQQSAAQNANTERSDRPEMTEMMSEEHVGS